MKKAYLPSADLEVSRRADALDVQIRAYLRDSLSPQSSVRRVYRIGPERGFQVSGYNGRARPLGTFLTGLKAGFFSSRLTREV